MTTGRINQVTTLYADEARGRTPGFDRPDPGANPEAEGFVYQEGTGPKSTARPPAGHPQRRRRRRFEIGHPIAPTEFPKAVVRHRRSIGPG